MIIWNAGFTFAKVVTMKQIKKQEQFFFDEFGEEINQRGNMKKVLISNATTNQNYYDDKFIRSRESLSCGELLDYKNSVWMIISQVDEKSSFFRARMRRADLMMKIYINGNLCGFYCYGEDTNVSLDENKIMTISSDEIRLVLPTTELTEQLVIGNRFLKFGAAWKITGFDKVKKGLITLCATKDVFNDDDDKENEIADRWKHETKHSYTISFINAGVLSFSIGETKQMEYAVYDAGVLVEETKAVTFTAGNTEVATIDAKGILTAVGIGSSYITVTLNEVPTVQATCGITVGEPEPSGNYSITLDYKSAIIKAGGLAKTYNAKVYNGTQLDYLKIVIWSITNTDGSTTNMATLVDKGNNSCTVQAVDNNDYIGETVILKAELSDDATVINELKLEIDCIY